MYTERRMRGEIARRVTAVVGVGPGLGLSIARRFAREGYIVAILSRNLEKLMKLAEEIVEKEAKAQVAAIRIDCADGKSVKEAFEAVHSLGAVETLVFNTNTPFPWPPPKFTDVKPESFERSITVPIMGAFYCAQQVLPGMVERRKGSILFTGATASLRGSAGFAELACGKFGLRGLAQCLAREYQPQGIHVAHVVIDGMIASSQNANDQTGLNPDAVADSFWQLHCQDKSAWTMELDLRPFFEKF
ncbi:3-dehydrosphinganine reductase TSC10B-like isoform X1 [Selaginella moellendorffii]|uniref:3-dehydrosphinganine reductase TSC10B-like isoform X1 n=2 Tax=Selaginella moellendorffii TaxID=88036 RepID=UPI000D1CA66D|nr:3-dehydrosphinganine reductase TSC10B-like isoform X1 [Selaginella moellendorffii]|eukprot:XP_024519776.1 3-dehydrosphinganine reductase TSC10B-like isoform X1 [Selaginella moellendorffii]